MWSFGKKGGSDHKTTPSQAKAPDGTAALAPSDPRSEFKKKKLSSSSRELRKQRTSKSPMGLPRTPQQELRKRRVIPGGSGHRRRSAAANAGDDYLEDMSVNETSNGIEVSFPGSGARANTPGAKGKAPVISLREQIVERQRVFKSQFSTVLTASNNESFLVNAKKWKPTGHRIPLLGITSSPPNYAEALQLLKTTPLIDERTAVQRELNFMEAEISSLERDRIWLEQGLQGLNTVKANPGSDDASMNKENATWDAHTLLKNDAIKKQPLPTSERSALQKQRGNYLTIHLSNNRVQERFILAFGGQQQLRRTTLFREDESIATLAPSSDSSTDTGATVLQHITLTASTSKAAGNGGLHFSPDLGKSQSIGHLSSKLCQRLDDKEKDIADVSYLSTGSRGSYFARFQSGECWWGSAVEDADFQNILNAWDVYRVEFGPMKTIENSKFTSSEMPDKKRNPKIQSEATLVNSWIILSTDGKAAWKNLPSRLASKLETRSAAPVEISLGIGDSYFVRFLDGTIDYSLPSKIARVCERIEERGGKITNISLHPDISHDFIVRHTELTR